MEGWATQSHQKILERSSPASSTLIWKNIFSGGSSLTRDESKASYAVVCYNIRTYASGGVVAVVKGRESGENIIKQYEASQSATERQEGWRCFLEKTEMKPGIDPQEATHQRQTSMDLREAENQP